MPIEHHTIMNSNQSSEEMSNLLRHTANGHMKNTRRDMRERTCPISTLKWANNNVSQHILFELKSTKNQDSKKLS
jgi:hypothetical protein